MHNLDIMKHRFAWSVHTVTSILYDDTKNFTHTHNSECTNYVIMYDDTTEIVNTNALCVYFERYLVQ